MNSKNSSAGRREQVQIAQPSLSCPLCGEEGSISTTWMLHTFDYGSDETRVELHVRVPVHRCGMCEFEYLDEVAEQLKHNAVCEHLGVLTPDQIREIREDHEMTRATFAHVTGLGEASLNRWENGLSIQTYANDRYLRLLKLPQNIRRLQGLMASRISETHIPDVVGDRFRVVKVTAIMREKQASFNLRPDAWLRAA